MDRPLRIEFPGAVYHVTSRGDRREDIFVDDEDRQGLLAVVAQALSRFDAEALAYCLMGNHYHLVLHTRQAKSNSPAPPIASPPVVTGAKTSLSMTGTGRVCSTIFHIPSSWI